MYKVDYGDSEMTDVYHYSLVKCTLVGLVAFGYKYGLRSDLRAHNFESFTY